MADKKLQKFYPVNAMLLVQPDEAPKMSAGGIILPEDAESMKKKTVFATVCEAGPDVKSPMVKRGARVAYNGYSGTPVELDGHKLLILEEKFLFLCSGDAK